MNRTTSGAEERVLDANMDRNLKSLNRFLDVLFALAFFRIVEYLPSFTSGQWVKLPHGLLSLLASSPPNLVRVVFGLVTISYFWFRKNTLLSLVEASNTWFATLGVASMACILLFMYALAADPMYIGGPPTLLLQSASFLVGSLLGYFSLRYAIHAGLTPPALQASAERMARIDLSNPLTAIIAIALSWSGLTIWTLSWFVFCPLFSVLLARRRPAQQQKPVNVAFP
jgi:hypothetical protein